MTLGFQMIFLQHQWSIYSDVFTHNIFIYSTINLFHVYIHHHKSYKDCTMCWRILILYLFKPIVRDEKKLIKLMVFSLYLLLLQLVSAFDHQGSINSIINSTDSQGNFVITRILPDGEIQRTVRWNGICAKETIVDWGYAN